MLLHADVTAHARKRCNVKHCLGKCSILRSNLKIVKKKSRHHTVFAMLTTAL